MRAIRADRFGEPVEALSCAEVADPPPPGAREATVEMLAMPINPADLLMIEGRYGVLPPLPFTCGSEGVGRVAALGSDASGLRVGDLAVPLAGQTFVERMTTKASNVIPLPHGTDPLQAAMLKANPATAELLLTEIVPLQPGDWLIQNAANSSVGQNVCRLAKVRQIRTINIVRRVEAGRIVSDAGGDVILVHDGSSARWLAEQAAQATNGASIKLAIDAIGGGATNALAAAVADGQRVVNYGLLSGQPCEIDPHHLVFRGVMLSGFWLAPWFRTAGREKIQSLYNRLVGLLADGTIHSEVAATYPLEQIAEAVRHAARGCRGGKVLLVANRPS